MTPNTLHLLQLSIAAAFLACSVVIGLRAARYTHTTRWLTIPLALLLTRSTSRIFLDLTGPPSPFELGSTMPDIAIVAGITLLVAAKRRRALRHQAQRQLTLDLARNSTTAPSSLLDDDYEQAA